MTNIDQEAVKRVAHLSRIGISDEEAERFSAELAKIVAFIEELQELDTDSVEAVGHITGMYNATRADKKSEKLTAEDNDMQEEQAPGATDGEIRVPRILP